MLPTSVKVYMCCLQGINASVLVVFFKTQNLIKIIKLFSWFYLKYLSGVSVGLTIFKLIHFFIVFITIYRTHEIIISGNKIWNVWWYIFVYTAESISTYQLYNKTRLVIVDRGSSINISVTSFMNDEREREKDSIVCFNSSFPFKIHDNLGTNRKHSPNFMWTVFFMLEKKSDFLFLFLVDS